MSAEATFWAWNQPLKSTQKLVLLCLANCHNPDTGQCDPSAKYIASKTGLNIKTIPSCLKSLSDLGLIYISYRRGTSPDYQLNLGCLEPVDPTQKRDTPKTGIPQKRGNPKTDKTPPKNGVGGTPKTGDKTKKKLKETKTDTADGWINKILDEFPEVPEQVAHDWIVSRKRKRGVFTQTAWDATVREIGKTGLGVTEVLQTAAERGWCGIRASYFPEHENQKKQTDDEIFAGAI